MKAALGAFKAIKEGDWVLWHALRFDQRLQEVDFTAASLHLFLSLRPIWPGGSGGGTCARIRYFATFLVPPMAALNANIAKVYFLIPPSIRTPTATNCCCWCLLSCLPRIPGPAACLRFSYDPRTARCLRASPFQLGLNYFAGSSQHDWGVLIRKYMKTSKQ